MNAITPYLPRPFYDIALEHEKLQEADSVTKGAAQKEYDDLIRRTIARIAVAALAAFAVAKLGLDAIATLAFTAVLISNPAALLAAGAAGIYYGAVIAVSALTSGVLLDLGLGVVLLMAGRHCLNTYDHTRWGVVEYVLDKETERQHTHVASLYDNTHTLHSAASNNSKSTLTTAQFD